MEYSETVPIQRTDGDGLGNAFRHVLRRVQPQMAPSDYSC